jgi:hypothetical protein
VLGYFNNEGGQLYRNVNIYAKEDKFPRRLVFPGVPTFPGRILFAQTNVTVDLHVTQIRAVDLLLHRQHFTEDHNGFFNIFAVENQVDCLCGVTRNNQT